MFKLENVHNPLDLSIEVEHNKTKLTFVIKNLINKRNKDELDPKIQFVLLEAYLNYKGDVFKDELFNNLSKVRDKLYMEINRKDIYPLEYTLVHGILDMFDLDDIYIFLKDVYRLPIPTNLISEFTEKTGQDGKISRVQTYTKNDYLELVALSLAIKPVLGPLGLFAYMKHTSLGDTHKEYIIFDFITSHPIYKKPAFVKMLGSVNKIIETYAKMEAESAARVIEKQLPKGELPKWILSIVTLQKLTTSIIVNDNADKSIVTRIYNFVNNKLQLKGDVSNTIRDKTPMADIDGDGDSESIIEAYRIVSDLPRGFIVELQWALSDTDRIMETLKLTQPEDIKLFNKLSGNLAYGQNRIINNIHLTILGWVLTDVIDPRALRYAKLTPILNLLNIVFIFLWRHDFKYIALLLLAEEVRVTEDVVYLNTTVNRSRITPVLKDRLGELYPYSRVVATSAKDKPDVNLSEEAINKLADSIFKLQWQYTSPIEFQEEYRREINASELSIPSSLKIMLAELVIKLYELKEV